MNRMYSAEVNPMINAWNLIWIIPLSVIVGGIAGVFVACWCFAAGEADKAVKRWENDDGR
jgi:hypothetical protein